jgi:hypothetical protein
MVRAFVSEAEMDLNEHRVSFLGFCFSAEPYTIANFRLKIAPADRIFYLSVNCPLPRLSELSILMERNSNPFP